MDTDNNLPEALITEFNASDIREEVAAASRNIFNETWQLKALLTGLAVAGY